ncbi:MAG: OpgC domain-containing protein [Pseudomonadota bacterium]
MATSADTSFGPGKVAASAAPAVRVRDPRLDFYRGIAMFIILMAHTPGNFFTSWIPARWGFSDATEMFVFCSGMASAIAFGRTYDRAGWMLGTARVGYRVWQVYWAHIGLFFAILALTIALTEWGIGTRNYWQQLALHPVLMESERWETWDTLLGLMTLRYVPNYFDILPMYMVILAMMPVIMLLARVHIGLVALMVIGFWIMAQSAFWETIGRPDMAWQFGAIPWREDRVWFFNPFGWQLAFFTGFAFMRGWLPAPPVKAWLIGLALLVVLANIPFSNIGVRELGFEWARDWRSDYNGLINKTDFGILRYTQFLALAYLGYVVAGEGGKRLIATGTGALGAAWNGFVGLVTKVGQQSLAVFLFSMFFARVMGFMLDVMGRSTWNVVLVNLVGATMLIIVAFAVAWFKGQPWRKPAK